MDGINIFRLIGVCGLLVAAWCVEVVGFATFRSEVSNGPPKMNVVDFDQDFSKEGSGKLLIGSGHDLNLPSLSSPFRSWYWSLGIVRCREFPRARGWPSFESR